jgi:hypothetical protein
MTHEDLVPLEEVAEQYFGINSATAKRKAALCDLPVPAFRLSDNGRGPLFVTRESLEKYISKQIEAAAKLHRQLSSV